jgi:PAS domain S-box-containing protein
MTGSHYTTALHRDALIAGAFEPLFTWLLYDGIVFWNHAAEELYGYSAAEAEGRISHDLLQTIHPLALYDLERTLVEKRVWHGELVHHTKDGREIVVDSRQRLVYTPEGTALVVEGDRDITQRKRAEKASRDSVQCFQGTFEQAAVGMAHVGVEGEWLLVNQRLCEMVGYTREELLQRTLADITHPEDIEADWSQARALLRGECKTYSMEKRYICRDGNTIWVNMTVSLLRDSNQRPHYFIAVIEDITARKRGQEEICALNATLEKRVEERTAKLAEANRELEAFVYTASHDLRAPLRTLEGFSQALLDDYGVRIDPTGRMYLERIVAAAVRMDLLIQDLLRYSRLTQAELVLERVNLGSAMQAVLRQLEPVIQRTGAEIDIEPDLPTVWGHDTTVPEAMANLVDNALKFVAPGVAPRLRVCAERRGEWIRFSVADNGIGIEPQYHQEIFQVFHRLHGLEAYPGTGIGLAIVRKGIERLAGRVGVESQPGQGSRFWFELKEATEDDRRRDNSDLARRA